MDDSYDNVFHKIASFRARRRAGLSSISSSRSSQVSFVTNLNASISDCIRPQKSIACTHVQDLKLGNEKKTAGPTAKATEEEEDKQANDAKGGGGGGRGGAEEAGERASGGGEASSTCVALANRVLHVAHGRAAVIFFTLLTWTNTVTLIAQAWPQVSQSPFGQALRILDDLFLFFYAAEACLHICRYKTSYFYSNSHVWDFAVLIINIIAFGMSLTPLSSNSLASQCLQATKVLRTVRAIRNICFFNGLLAILNQSLQSLCTIGSMILLTTYTFAVIGCGIYGDAVPQHFGTVFTSFACLYRQLTLNHWDTVYTDAALAGRQDVAVYLVAYLVINYFTFFNLLTAVFVDSFSLYNCIHKRPGAIHPESDRQPAQGQGQGRGQGILHSQPLEKGHKSRLTSPWRLLHYNNDHGTHYHDLVATVDCYSEQYKTSGALTDLVLSTCGDTHTTHC